MLDESEINYTSVTRDVKGRIGTLLDSITTADLGIWRYMLTFLMFRGKIQSYSLQ